MWYYSSIVKTDWCLNFTEQPLLQVTPVSPTALPARDSSILLTRVTWKKNVRRDPGYCADPGHCEMDQMLYFS